MLKRLKIWQKFTLIAVAFSIPIVVLSYFLLHETGKVISFSAAEVDGTEYMRSLRKVVLDVSAHRDLASAVLAGDATYKGDLEKKAAEIEADFKALEEVDDRYAWEFGLTDQLRAVRQAWQTLRNNFPSFKLEQSLEEHTRYVRVLLQFAYRIGNASNLILDPDVDSYYVVDALIFKIPKVAEEISRARAIASAFLASGGSGEENSDRRLQLMSSVVRIEDALQQQLDFIRFARDFNPRTDQALAGSLNDHTKAVRGFTALLTEKIINSGGDPMPLKDYFAAASAPLAEAAKLGDVMSSELRRLLDGRINTLNRTRWTEIGLVLGALLLSILLLTIVVRAITRPIAHLRDVADKISLGDMDAQIQIDSKDEIGELGDSFRRLQVSLKEAMDTLERQSEAHGG